MTAVMILMNPNAIIFTIREASFCTTNIIMQDFINTSTKLMFIVFSSPQQSFANAES